jgi:hypothetical protein
MNSKWSVTHLRGSCAIKPASTPSTPHIRHRRRRLHGIYFPGSQKGGPHLGTSLCSSVWDRWVNEKEGEDKDEVNKVPDLATHLDQTLQEKDPKELKTKWATSIKKIQRMYDTSQKTEVPEDFVGPVETQYIPGTQPALPPTSLSSQ